MKITRDLINDGLGFEINFNGQTYSGIVTMEALQAHFQLQTHDLKEIERFFIRSPQKLELEICHALQCHPPLSHNHILIFPHHLH